MLIEHHIEDRAHARLCDGRDLVAVLTQEAIRLAKGVDELKGDDLAKAVRILNGSGRTYRVIRQPPRFHKGQTID